MSTQLIDLHRDVEIALEAARKQAAAGELEAEEMRKIAPGLFPKPSRRCPVALATSPVPPAPPIRGGTRTSVYLHEKPCPICGQAIYGPRDKLYCGRECNQAAYDKRRRELYAVKSAKVRAVPVVFVHPEPCVCGKPIVGRKDKRHCSLLCKNGEYEQRREYKYKARPKLCRECQKPLTSRTKLEYCATCTSAAQA